MSGERGSALSPALAAALSDRMELRAWRLLGAQLEPLVETALAGAGDRADRQLVSIQHSLAELRVRRVSTIK